MSPDAAMLFTYVWHYVVARFLYDGLVRPLLHGRVTVAAIVVPALAVAVLVASRRRSRRRSR